MLKKLMKRFGRTLLSFGLIVAGIFSAAFGLKGFLLSSRFIDGGVTGISMLLSDVLHAPLSILLLVINLPFIAIGYRHIGRAFAIKSVLSIAGLSLCLAFVKFPDVTPDKLLTAVFGGFFIGAGIGLANTIARLQQLYDDDHEFDIRNRDGGGVEVVIVVPLRTA